MLPGLTFGTVNTDVRGTPTLQSQQAANPCAVISQSSYGVHMTCRVRHITFRSVLISDFWKALDSERGIVASHQSQAVATCPEPQM